MKIEKIKGLIAAPYTPMHADTSINCTEIKPYANKLKADGVNGVFICGTTGEGMLLTNNERRQIAEAWVKEQTESFKVIVHTGTTSAIQSKQLAEHAQQIGAYATATMAPTFLKPDNVDDLVDFCKIAASGAPNIPFYYYNMPTVSGVHVSPYNFLQKAATKIPNLTGIKFTDNNLLAFQQCMNYKNGTFDILHGYDEMLLAGLSFGAKGAVGSTYNYMAPLYHEIIEAFNNGNLNKARELQYQSVKIIEVLIKYGGALNAGKKIMELVGINCGPNRTPIKTFSNSKTNEFVDELINAGLHLNISAKAALIE